MCPRVAPGMWPLVLEKGSNRNGIIIDIIIYIINISICIIDIIIIICIWIIDIVICISICTIIGIFIGISIRITENPATTLSLVLVGLETPNIPTLGQSPILRNFRI